MTNEEKLHEQILELEMENHALKQKLVGHEYERFSLQTIQKLAKAGNWQLNHLSYEISLSDELKEMLGLATSTMTWDKFISLISVGDEQNLKNLLLRAGSEHEQDAFFCHQYHHPNGHLLFLKHFSRTFLNSIGQPLKTVGLVQDVTEEQRQAHSLKQLSITDELTGLYNRREINTLLQGALNPDDNRRFALILLDLDLFKQINDTFGHLYGDKVLKHLAKLLRQHAPAPALCARWGGEEFLVFMPDSCQETATLIAEKIRTEMAAFTLPNGRPLTASFGVTSQFKGDSLDSILSRVDQLMYTAKQSGRDRVCSAGFEDLPVN